MINAYYRPSIWWNTEAVSKLGTITKSALKNLPEREKSIAAQLYLQMGALLFDEQRGFDIENPEKYYEEHLSELFEVVDEDGEKIRCRLDFGELESWHDYENASHSFYGHAKVLSTVLLSKGEDDFEKSEELSAFFDGLVYSAGSSIGEGDEVHYAHPMTPEVDSLLSVRSGIAPRVEMERRKALERAIQKEKEEREEDEALSEQDRPFDEMEETLGTTNRTVIRKRQISGRAIRKRLNERQMHIH